MDRADSTSAPEPRSPSQPTPANQHRGPVWTSAILATAGMTVVGAYGIFTDLFVLRALAWDIATVLEQMRAERRAEAGKLRAEGEREAQRIRDDVLVKCEEIRRQGREESGKIVGQAEKEAAEIYARAHRLDPEFYRFWRSLQAIQKTLGTKATVILRTDQGFFDVLAAPPKHLHAPQPSSESPAARATPPEQSSPRSPAS